MNVNLSLQKLSLNKVLLLGFLIPVKLYIIRVVYMYMVFFIKTRVNRIQKLILSAISLCLCIVCNVKVHARNGYVRP